MRIALLIISFFYVNVALSQFTYTVDQHVSVGDESRYEVTNLVNPTIDFAATGTDYEWDFSEINPLRNDTIQYIDPEESGYKVSYCLVNAFLFSCNSEFSDLTNIALRSADSLGFGELKTENIVRHFKADKDSYAETMLGLTGEVNGISLPAAFDFEKPDTVLQFPFTYESEDSSASRLEVDLTGIGVDIKVSRDKLRKNIVEGYGTLETPSGIYNEVLKMKTLIWNRDTTRLDTVMIPISTQEIEYKWFAEGFAGPVMVASGLVVGGSELIGEVRFLEEAETSQVGNIDLSNNITVYPNPFKEQLYLQGDVVIDRIEIYDLQGKLVHINRNVSNNITPEIQSGAYLIKILSGDSSTTELVVKL